MTKTPIGRNKWNFQIRHCLICTIHSARNSLLKFYSLKISTASIDIRSFFFFVGLLYPTGEISLRVATSYKWNCVPILMFKINLRPVEPEMFSKLMSNANLFQFCQKLHRSLLDLMLSTPAITLRSSVQLSTVITPFYSTGHLME